MGISSVAPIDDMDTSLWSQSEYFYLPSENTDRQYGESADDYTVNHLPVSVSPGPRKMFPHRRGGYQLDRVRKDHTQVKYLRQLYAETGGKLDRR